MDKPDIPLILASASPRRKEILEAHGYKPVVIPAHVDESAFDETEISVQVQGLGKKAQMMVCMGNTNRADLRIGSLIKIKEFFDSGNQKTSSCYHDELLICKITHTADSNGSYENEFMAISSACERNLYSFRVQKIEICPLVRNQNHQCRT